jgi:5-methylcytosine-specific restriction protein A
MPRAPRHCGINGCVSIVPAGQRCPEHRSTWSTAPRSASSKRTSTRAWRQQRAKVLQRDQHTCQLRYPDICIGTATQIDHCISVADGGGDEMSNCQSVCTPCHQRKSSREAAQARNNWKRLPEPHPGLIL